MSDFGVVLAAAGAGRRFGTKKQLLEVLGRPILHYSLDAFSGVEDVGRIVLVLPPDDLVLGEEVVRSWRAAGAGASRKSVLPVAVVGGGARRQDSVRRGLDALPPSIRYVLVHDAARPLIEPEAIRRMAAATREHGAAVIGVPSFDSVKRVLGGAIVGELPRDEVWTVQTPQSGEVSTLKRAYDAAGGTEMTDEATALRALGIKVALVEGSRDNVKITRPEDLHLAEAILRARGV